MYKRQSAPHESRSGPWFRKLYGRNHILSFTAVVLGTIYYSGRRVYADEPHHHPNNIGKASISNIPNELASTPRNEDEVFVRSRLWSLSNANFDITGNCGIRRFDFFSLPNVSPQQDISLFSSFQVASGSSWTLFTLCDGYDGWENAIAVSNQLAIALANGLYSVFMDYEPPAEHTEIGAVPHGEPGQEPYDDAINRKIKDIFVDVDDSIVHKPFNFTSGPPSKASITAALGVALSGSSAMLAFYDSEPRRLKIALTGNSRAVLGRRTPPKDGRTSYEVHVLTAEQACSNPTEAARLDCQHPDESSFPQTPVCGLSRAFGLATCKWSHEVQERLHREFLGGPPLPNAKPHPYLTAEPEITTIEVEPGDFLVMASQGLWNSLTNEEVVGLVGLWLDRGIAIDSDTSSLPVDVIHPGDLPVSLGTDNTVMYSRWRAEKKFLCVDNHAAGHLARNALGGADVSLTAALLAMEPPRAQKFREGINMTVIFFDDK
ncbi:phosphatase 2C-like domain-containing protein [Lyophyllum atratum]|nr:phosphatase 2C-like domain-containing protein [Lyophyllum atratum]